MLEIHRDAAVLGGLIGALVLGLAGRGRGGFALALAAAAAVAGAVLGVLIPADLLHLPAWTGLSAEVALLPAWALYAALARSAGRPAIPGPPAVVAAVAGALLGEVAAAALLGAAATDRKAAARLALAAAGGGLVGRIGDPALLLYGGRYASMAYAAVPLAALCLLLAWPRRADLAPGGSAAVTGVGLATAGVALVPGLAPWALVLGALGLGVLGRARLREAGWGDVAWAVGSVALVLTATAGGAPELVATGLEQLTELWGPLPPAGLAAASGLLAMLVDAPAAALFGVATVDRALDLDPVPLARALALGAAAGGVGPLVAAGALRHGWWRWLLVIAAAAGLAAIF